MTPQERKLRAQIAAHTRWSRCNDRPAATANARAGFYARFERQVDPDGLLDPQERAKRANHALAAHMARLNLARRKAHR